MTEPLRRPKLRVWKLGSLEHRLVPAEETIRKLAEMLEGWDGKSDLDIVWGPDLTVEQFDLDAGDAEEVSRADDGGPRIRVIRQEIAR